MKRFVFLLLLLLVFVCVSSSPATARPPGKSVTVQARDADITLLTNSDVRLIETWRVEFSGGFTYAFRQIPINHATGIDDWGVSEDGRTYKAGCYDPDCFHVGDEGASKKITWNFAETNKNPSTLFSETRTFVLSYTVHGAVRIYPGGDQLWWKFVEADRAYFINSARVVLHLPATFPTAQLKATSYWNNREIGGARAIDGQTIELNAGPFEPNVEWEIRAQFPHGSINASAPAWQVAEDERAAAIERAGLYSIAAAFLILIAGGLGLFLLWYLFGRDHPVGPVAEYLAEPAENIPPGMVGTLLDEQADLQDILATIVDLAHRGYLNITNTEGYQGRFKLMRTGGDTRILRAYEQDLLDHLFHDQALRDSSELQGSFYYYLPSLQDTLYGEVTGAGYFRSNPFETRAFWAQAAKRLLIAIGIVGAIVVLLTFQLTPLIALPFVSLMIVCAGLWRLSRYMPKKTRQGAQMAQKWQAFKRYLANVERYTQVAAARDQFEKYLAYAIAFGLERGWVEKFAAVQTPAPQWYSTHRDASSFRWPEEGEETRDTFRPIDALNRDTEQSDTTWRTLGYPLGERSAGESSKDAEGNRQTPSALEANMPPNPTASLPSLNTLADNAFIGLDTMSNSFFDMLNSAASTLTSSRQQESSSGGGPFGWVSDLFDGLGELFSRSGSSGGDVSHSGSSSRSSSDNWSGGGSRGGGGGGGGSSGFG